MLILVPMNEEGNLTTLESRLSAKALRELYLYKLSESDVELSMPKFKLDEDINLKKTLIQVNRG